MCTVSWVCIEKSVEREGVVSVKRGKDAVTPWMVLIGPAGCGKTSLGLELSANTARAFVDLDACAEEEDPGAKLVATRTVYNEGETPAQTAARLLLVS